MNHYLLRFVLLVLLGLSGCASQTVREQPVTPQSKQALLVEVSAAGRLLYEVWGVGENITQARQDAKKAALWAALHAGQQRLLNTPEARARFKSLAKKYYRQVDEYVRYLSSPLSKQVDEQGRVHLKFRVAIDTQLLQEQLQSDGVLADNAQLNSEIGLPSVVVLSVSPEAKAAANVLEQQLVNQGFSLVDKNTRDKNTHLIEKVARLNGQVDPMFLLASKTGADVYVEVKASVQHFRDKGVEGAQASVQARAYETASAQLLGSATGYSPKRVGTASEALVQEAANDAASVLTARLLKVWQQQATQGIWYKLVASLNPQQAEAQEMQLYQALRALKPTQLKRLKAGERSVSYLVRLKGMPDATSLYYALKQHYVGAGQLKRELESGRLLILRLDDSTGEMQLD